MGKHGKYRALVGAALAIWLAVTAGAPAIGAPCRLALLLAIDVSSSVDMDEDALQRQGIAAALLAPEVQRAFLARPGPVALAVYEWSGRNQQQVLVDWRLMRTPADLLAAAETLHASRRGHDDFPTAMGYALGYGAGLMRRAPDCARQVIDISGDGVNNEGFAPRIAYGAFPFHGVQVNGLAIAVPGEEGRALLSFYLDEIRLGPGAFVEVADGFEDIERAMRRKLMRELVGAVTGARMPERGAG